LLTPGVVLVAPRLTAAPLVDPHAYPGDPAGYAANVLGVTLTPDQEAIARAVLEPPFKVKVPSGHNVGKTMLAAVLVNWWYDSFDPGVVITTAPTERDVVDLLWAEIRRLRARAPAGLAQDFIGPRAPEMRTSDTHWAKGYTARKGESFQGRHHGRMLFVFDEDEGVDPGYWTTTKSMFKAEEGHAWLSIGNPTTSTSQAAQEERALDRDGNPAWRVIRLSALDHPNLEAERNGRPPGIPEAVTLAQVNQWVADWCEPIPAGERVITDLEWPAGSGQWHRPGPIAEARILGRRPAQGTNGVWSDGLWDAAERLDLPVPIDRVPEIGCDVARYGDDWTAIHVRWGPASVHHESHNGWATDRTAGRLKELAREWAGRATAARAPTARPVPPEEIPIKVDDDGVGGGVIDQRGGYRFTAVSAAARANDPEAYNNRRSELWFTVAERARHGRLALARLPRDVRQRLRVQALAPEYTVDGSGRRVVEPKHDTKAKLGRSPDEMDAMNLSYFEVPASVPSVLPRSGVPAVVNPPRRGKGWAR
jgi:hypothetical protein